MSTFSCAVPLPVPPPQFTNVSRFTSANFQPIAPQAGDAYSSRVPWGNRVAPTVVPNPYAGSAVMSAGHAPLVPPFALSLPSVARIVPFAPPPVVAIQRSNGEPIVPGCPPQQLTWCAMTSVYNVMDFDPPPLGSPSPKELKEFEKIRCVRVFAHFFFFFVCCVVHVVFINSASIWLA